MWARSYLTLDGEPLIVVSVRCQTLMGQFTNVAMSSIENQHFKDVASTHTVKGIAHVQLYDHHPLFIEGRMVENGTDSVDGCITTSADTNSMVNG